MSEIPEVNVNTLEELVQLSKKLLQNTARSSPEIEAKIHELAGTQQVGSGTKQVAKVGFKDKPLVDPKDKARAEQLKKEWEAPSASGIKGFFLNPLIRPGLAMKKTVATLGEGLGVKMYEPRSPLDYELIGREKISDAVAATYKKQMANTLGIDHEIEVLDQAAKPETFKWLGKGTQQGENPLNADELGMFGGTPTKANVLSEAAGRTLYATGLGAALKGLGADEPIASLGGRIFGAGTPLSRDEMTKRSQEVIKKDNEKLQLEQDDVLTQHGFIGKDGKWTMNKLTDSNKNNHAKKFYGKETHPMGNWLLNSLYETKEGKTVARPEAHKAYFERFNKAYEKDLKGGNEGANQFADEIESDYYSANHDAKKLDHELLFLPSIKKQNGVTPQLKGHRAALYIDRKNGIRKFVDINERDQIGQNN